MAFSTPALKVVLCGEYGVGKSSIFRRFVDNTFVEETGPRSAIGLDNFTKNFKIEDKIAKVLFLLFASNYLHLMCNIVSNLL